MSIALVAIEQNNYGYVVITMIKTNAFLIKIRGIVKIE